MGRKGTVKRMSSASLPEAKPEPGEAMPDRWTRSQDHFTRFTDLIKQELDDETQLVEERWTTWTKGRLAASGLALFDLSGRARGRFFGDDVLVFEARDGGRMPEHRFTPGDIVLISRSKPWTEKVVEGVVLDRGPTRLRVVVKDRPKDLRKGTWRLDRGANRVAHDRMHEALIAFHSTEGDGGTVLRDVLLANVLDINQNAALPPEIRGGPRGPSGPPPSMAGLNPSQRAAVETAMQQRLTLIQGPPVPGKPTPLCVCSVRWLRRGQGRSWPRQNRTLRWTTSSKVSLTPA